MKRSAFQKAKQRVRIRPKVGLKSPLTDAGTCCSRVRIRPKVGLKLVLLYLLLFDVTRQNQT